MASSDKEGFSETMSSSECSMQESDVSHGELEDQQISDFEYSEEHDVEPSEQMDHFVQLSKTQSNLQETFKTTLMPFLNKFIEKAKEKDEHFQLFSNMLTDLQPYIYGFISMRFQDFEGQLMVAKMMFERVHVSQQSLYKHIIKEVLTEVPTWDTFDRNCFSKAPGANEIGGSVGASLARDEAHERVISKGLAYQHPKHPTPHNVEIMCQSAPVLCKNQENLETEFFPSRKHAQKNVTSGQSSEEERIVQTFISTLNDFKAFKVLGRTLIQPGTTVKPSRDQASNFLNRSKISRKIAVAIVEQQILHKTIYDRSVLKKKVIHPLPSTNVKKTRNTKSKPELERKLLVSLVMGQMKQQQGLSMATLPGIQQDLSMTTLPGMGIAKYPPLYFNEDGFPLTNIQKKSIQMEKIPYIILERIQSMINLFLLMVCLYYLLHPF